MRINALVVLGLTFAALNAAGQLIDVDPNWKELDVPVPPAFKTDRLITIDMPRHISLRLGVDPQTLRVTGDGIVRYVMVATSSSGNINATYEGIRCLTGEVKTYARYGAAGQWNPVVNPEWKPLNGNQPSLHALALARQGACEGRAAASQSPAAIITKLKTPSLDYDRR